MELGLLLSVRIIVFREHVWGEKGVGACENEHTREFNLINQLQSSLLGRDVIPFDTTVHESDLNPIVIEEGGCVGDSGHDPRARISVIFASRRSC